MLFMIPGMHETLRMGRNAWDVKDAQLRAQMVVYEKLL